jgi:hypothetical protein
MTKDETKEFARELALTISYRIIDDEKLQDITVRQMVRIRDVVEEETIALIEDFEQKKMEEEIKSAISPTIIE